MLQAGEATFLSAWHERRGKEEDWWQDTGFGGMDGGGLLNLAPDPPMAFRPLLRLTGGGWKNRKGASRKVPSLLLRSKKGKKGSVIDGSRCQDKCKCGRKRGEKGREGGEGPARSILLALAGMMSPPPTPLRTLPIPIPSPPPRLFQGQRRNPRFLSSERREALPKKVFVAAAPVWLSSTTIFLPCLFCYMHIPFLLSRAVHAA